MLTKVGWFNYFALNVLTLFFVMMGDRDSNFPNIATVDLLLRKCKLYTWDHLGPYLGDIIECSYYHCKSVMVNFNYGVFVIIFI